MKRGRKLKYGESTTWLSFLVPVSKKEDIRKQVKSLLEKYIPNNNESIK